MRESLNQLERFLHEDGHYPTLIEVALAHAQFETIHPFLDGNGRVGRLLNIFLLVHQGLLRRPLLYLSYYFKLHRAEYYDRLMAIRLRGTGRSGSSCGEWRRPHGKRRRPPSASSEMRETHRIRVIEHRLGDKGLLLLSHLFERPLVNIKFVASLLDVAFPTAARLVTGFEEIGLLREITGQKRSRAYRYEPYLALFDDAIGDADEGAGPADVTESST